MPLRPDDLALIRGALAREPASTAALERAVEAAARAAARRVNLARARPPFDVDDLAQAVHVALWARDGEALRQFSGRAALSTWLHTIAWRHALRAARPAAPVEPPGPSADASPVERVARGERIDRVRAVLADLAPDERLLVQVYFEGELGAEAAGRVLGLTPDAVRMRKMRLLRRLADRLKGLWP